MSLREELIAALQAEFDGEDPCETTCANAALKVFREWLGSEAVSDPLYVAPKNTQHWDGYSEGWASALVRLASLTEASE
tara:strand:+ start:1472 stop:1708 length:237 start_codon:yes stop_codon:yes gene_type:complete